MTYKPSLNPQVARLDQLKAESLLSRFCTSITDTRQFGLTCVTRSLGPAFADLPGGQFLLEGVIHGHFLSADSEEAAVSGQGPIDSHPSHWGGTLLLTRGDGKWRPLWYKSGLITRSCEKAERPDGREILICEYEDGGMGHRYHVLDAIDLKHASTETPPLVVADSFDSDYCTTQQQTMEAVRWAADRRSFSVTVRTPKWQLLREDYCDPHPPKRPKPSVGFEFEVTNEGLSQR